MLPVDLVPRSLDPRYVLEEACEEACEEGPAALDRRLLDGEN